MFTTTLFKKPVKSCDLICKIALYGEDPEESGFQNKYPWELIVNVPKPVQVVEFRDRLIGAMNLSHEFEVLFHGIVLKHDSFLPEECYEQQYGSEEDFFFRSRLVICVDLSKKLLKSALTLKEDEQSDQENVSDDGDRQTDALHEDASLENIPPKVDFEEFKSNHKSFDLFHELKRIDCDQFTEEMMKAGYDKEVIIIM